MRKYQVIDFKLRMLIRQTKRDIQKTLNDKGLSMHDVEFYMPVQIENGKEIFELVVGSYGTYEMFESNGKPIPDVLNIYQYLAMLERIEKGYYTARKY